MMHARGLGRSAYTEIYVDLHDEQYIMLLKDVVAAFDGNKKSVVTPDNLFVILNKERDERTHCRILCYLICGFWTEFRDKFVDGCQDDMILSAVCEEPCKAIEGCPEKGDGRVDIYIETQNYIIPIEVKVDAGEQWLQLIRYYKYFNDEAKRTGKKVKLLFVTPSGRESSQKVCKKKDVCNHCDGISEYTPISFKSIQDWLKTCKDTAANEIAKVLAESYCAILDEDIRSMEVKDIIIDKHDEDAKQRFYAAYEIYGAYNSAVEAVTKEFFEALAESFGKEYTVRFCPREKKEYMRFKDVSSVRIYGTQAVGDGADEKTMFTVCISNNLFVRDEQRGSWCYIVKDWFDEDATPTWCGKESDADKAGAINGRDLSGQDNPIVSWYFCPDEEKRSRQIQRIANLILAFISGKIQL